LASNETGFLVERKIGGGDWTALPTLGAAQTGVGKVVNYVDNLVTPIAYGPYQYRVSAISGTAAPFKASSPSVLSAPLEFSLPTAPTNIIATPGTVGTVNVSWSDNALNETGFTLQRATNSTFTAGLVSTKIVGANSLGTFNYLVTNLKSKTNYYFRAQATNAVGGSSFSILTGSVKAP
jgi:predicted phage tail protein